MIKKLKLSPRLFTCILIGIALVVVSLLFVMSNNKLNSRKIQNEPKEQRIQQLKRQNQDIQKQLQSVQDQLTFKPVKLLEYTNEQRAKNGLAALALSQKLNTSAQAKADDMIARNYWSHNTPDGSEPWVFFQKARYSYSKIGENLAYGYATGQATILGWMGSAEHKANLLNSDYTQVGFGTKLRVSFRGEITNLVVAHYGKPN